MRETTAAQIPLCPNLQQGQVRAAARAWGSGGGGGHWGGGGGYHWGGGGGGGGPGPESIYTLTGLLSHSKGSYMQSSKH